MKLQVDCDRSLAFWLEIVRYRAFPIVLIELKIPAISRRPVMGHSAARISIKKFQFSSLSIRPDGSVPSFVYFPLKLL